MTSSAWVVSTGVVAGWVPAGSGSVDVVENSASIILTGRKINTSWRKVMGLDVLDLVGYCI